MSALLYRLGRRAALRPLMPLLSWLFVILAVVALLVTQAPSISTSLTLDDAPAQQVLDEVTEALPEAGGTQGTLVFQADDGGRVDTPVRADAIDRALDTAAGSGLVQDRDARLLDQQADVEVTVRENVEARVADDVTVRIEELVETLEGGLPVDGPAAQGEQAAQLAPRIAAISATARDLLAAPDDELISGSSDLFADVEQLQADLSRAGMDLGVLPAPEDGMSDPAAAVEAATATATADALGRLDSLLGGTSPRGTELLTSDGVRPSVLVSDDGTAAIASVQLNEQVSDLPAGSLDDLMASIDTVVADEGLTVAASSSLQPLEPPIGGHEAIGLAIAAVVLIITLGSLVLAGLPILLALVGVFIGVGGAYALSGNFEMTTSTPALGLMLGLAVGIDYALFIVHKQRSLQVRFGLDTIESTARAVATAGGAVLFAGATVVIALLGLLTLGMGFVSTMAVTAAVTVALAVALALTALPALLGLLGRRRRRAAPQPQARPEPQHGHSRFGRAAQRWITAVTARPILTIVLVGLALGALAVPAGQMELGMPSGAVAAPGSEQRTAYDAVSDALGEGANAPLVVALTPTDPDAVDQDRLEAWQIELADHDSASNVRLMGTSEDRSLVLYTVVPTAGPTDPGTADLVHAVRGSEIADVEQVGVTGLTAINIDLSESLRSAIPVYLGLVALLSLAVLLLVFRSLVVPLAATGGFLLSIGATLGLVVTAFGNPDFTWLVGVDRAGPVLSFLPIMATGILYGLAMDYQVFLGTSIREVYVHGASARQAVVDGFHHASRVVVAAAVIMVSVFAGFVLSDDAMIRQFGFALSAGILIDAFLIRMTLIPAILHLAGDKAWWLPRWMDRILPDLDLEGTRLEIAPAPTEARTPAPTAPPLHERLVR
ncbi:transporter [Actinotalea ferrariae CF5-4]|uniref:Transporter n=1 Tax=Actinotalea ferrariae CF5-4 TaxID=948458 RepID=A0A021W1P1_9CELL|nr:MMPL family transporter [Actinotalea ferrariae]EYR65252.1 transporter [Actinotalea ferrariae CF5-4]